MSFDAYLEEFILLEKCCQYISRCLTVHGYVRKCEIIPIFNYEEHKIQIVICINGTEKTHQIKRYVFKYLKYFFEHHTEFTVINLKGW